MTMQEVQTLVEEYVQYFPEERERLKLLLKRLESVEPFNHRKSFTGHGTGGAFVLSPDRKKLLLIHHKFLDMWLQPGGHWDPEDPNPWTVAQREAEEETGVHIDKLLPLDEARPYIPIDIDSHAIKARPERQEPMHYHHDIRYIFLAKDTILRRREEEVLDCAWIALDDVAQMPAYFLPIIEKMRRAKIIA